eukprot:3826350-Lingulodinium_polyedra.AAC.1
MSGSGPEGAICTKSPGATCHWRPFLHALMAVLQLMVSAASVITRILASSHSWLFSPALMAPL